MQLKNTQFGVPFRFADKITSGVWMRLRCVDTNVGLTAITITCLDALGSRWDKGDTVDATADGQRPVETTSFEL